MKTTRKSSADSIKTASRPKQKVSTAFKTRGHKPLEMAMRWTINRAAREFGLHREQLERRRRALGIESAEDGCFSSQEIARMMFGDKEAETIGKIAAERQKLERENREADGELVPVERVAVLGERFVAAVRQIILNSSLSEAEKREVLGEIVQLEQTDWTREARNATKE